MFTEQIGKIVCVFLSIMFLSACSGSSTTTTTTTSGTSGTSGVDTNVASSSNGAVATSSFNAVTAKNINDGDLTSTWISDPDQSIVVKFQVVEKIKKITLKKVSSNVSAGSSPDILVELSVDGVVWKTSNLTKIFGGDVGCINTSIASEQLLCDMLEYDTQYIRITSKNGKSFEFKELEVIANK